MVASSRKALTAEPRLEIAPGKLGAPGAPVTLTAVAIMPNEQRSDKSRLLDTSRRSFRVAMLLVRETGFLDAIKGDFTKEDGSSHVRAQSGSTMLKVATAGGTFEIELNAKSEFSMISMRVEATTANEARNTAHDAVAPFLDHLAFMAQTPILTGLTRVEDEKNQLTTLVLVAPEQVVTLIPGGQTLFEELAPIYALYREFKNAVSPFYRLLCAYKIMEGVYGVLRKAARERAKSVGVRLCIPKEVVPNHPDIAPDLRNLIGKPIKSVCDNILQKRYRDAAAHFLVQETIVLKVSSAAERSKFSEMAFLCDLCAQIVIRNHEAVLEQLGACSRA